MDPTTWQPPIPPHAYVPGQSERHDSAFFEDIHSSVRDGMSPVDLIDTAAWRAGQFYLRNGYYWEAHEALEPVWMKTLPNSVERHLVQAMIQIANAALKERMNRPRAVRRLCDLAAGHLGVCQTRDDAIMGIRLSELEDLIGRLREEPNLP